MISSFFLQFFKQNCEIIQIFHWKTVTLKYNIYSPLPYQIKNGKMSSAKSLWKVFRTTFQKKKTTNTFIKNLIYKTCCSIYVFIRIRKYYDNLYIICMYESVVIHLTCYCCSWKSKRPWSRKNVSTANTRTSCGRYVTGCCGTAEAVVVAEGVVADTANRRRATITQTKRICMMTTCSGTGTTNRRTNPIPKNSSWSTPTTGTSNIIPLFIEHIPIHIGEKNLKNESSSLWIHEIWWRNFTIELFHV